jgi:UDP-galactopyranose mutase
MKIAIVGAGISGVTAAYIIKKYDSSIHLDIFEENKNIGGNCADEFTDNGYLQMYGPHIFHTNKKYIWNYLRKYSDFYLYQHKVKSYVNGEYKQFPFTKNFIKSYDNNILQRVNEDNSKFTNAEEYLYYILGKELTDNFFKNYSEKQWGIPFNELPIDVVRRIPIRENNDTRYFSDRYQGIPKVGFTQLLKNICDDAQIKIKHDKVVFANLQSKYDLILNTAPVDEFFSNQYSELQYRSVIFKTELGENAYPVSVVNYPNDYDFTRTTEYNYFASSQWKSLEYPVEQNTQNSKKCYPIFWDISSQKNFVNYAKFAKENNVILLGRMGLYQYLNIDAAIDVAFSRLTRFNSEQLAKEIQHDIIV